MSNLTKQQFVYDVGGLIAPLTNAPVVAQRAPTTSDFALPGQIWIDTPNNAIYMLASITANSANWTTSPASGVGAFTSVTVNPGNVTLAAGNLTLALGNLALTAGNLTVGGDLTVSGTSTFTGDIDFTSALLVDVTSTLDAAPSILLQADGGTSEQIRLYSNQGTAVDSLYLYSNMGGITLRADLASADAINLSATAGGVDVDGALQVNIASSYNNAAAMVLSASAGGIDITAAGSAGEDIDISNSASINLTSSEAVADAITITASHAAGGVTIDAGTGGIEIGNTATCSPIDIGDFVPTSSRLITIAGGTVTTAVTDRVDIAVDGLNTNAGAVKQVDIASGNILLGTSTVNINSGTAASGTSTVNISTGTGGGTKVVNVGNADGLTTINIDAITLINDSINVNTSINTGTSTGAVTIGNGAAGAVTVDSGAGISLDGAAASNFSVSGAGIDVTIASAAGQAIINGGEAAVNAVRINATDAAGGIDIDCGTGGATFDSTGAISLDAAAASNFSVSGAGIDLTLASAGGQLIMNAEEAAANALRMLSAAGGLDANVALQMNLDSSQAAADAIRIIASNAAGGLDIDCGTGGAALDSTGAVSLQGAAASDFSVSGAGIDLTLASAAGRVIMNGEEAAADALTLLSAAGGLDVNVALQMNLDSSQAAADAIRIFASNAAGGIDVDYGTGGMTVTGANGAYTLASGTGAINISADAAATTVSLATGAAAKTLTVGSTNTTSTTNIRSGTGGINLSSGGIATVASSDNTIASPTASTTLNVNVGSATFTGFTTAAAATQDFTITNSLVTTSSKILCTVCNEGANDAQIEIRRITRAAGSFVVKVVNSGAAALNGNVIITFWVLS